ncbi:MAG: prolyl oligopeptidase family serine peptidase [Actinomycetota bacterium]|nr:prolyl oligopeptidase family serine peptidase [Actinomycetota bacterium]
MIGLVGKLLALVVAAVLGMGQVAASAQTAEPAADPGELTSGTVTSNGLAFPFLLYTPATYQPDRPMPLLVVAHGCQTTAQQEMEITRYSALAEREGIVVVYPEVDEVSTQLPGPLRHCWGFLDPTSYFRGNAHPAAIAAVTRHVMDERAIDDERVYLVGVSAGGLMTSASAGMYPELYTAVGLVVTAGFADGLCFTTGIGIPAEASALLAHQQMGPRARVVPAIAIAGDADLAFPPTCTHKAVEQSLRTNNLVLSGTQTAPLALLPHAERQEQVPDGLASTVSTYLDPDGCVVAEKWIIHGMAHTWPGGAEYGGYTDTRAPDGAELTWRFLERFRKSETSMPCAASAGHRAASPETTPSTAPPIVPTTVDASGGTLPATGGGGGLALPALLAGAALAAGGIARRTRRPTQPRT